ncbi:MAG: PAS domain-containing protein [Mycobacteriaceae bacterium]|nr:PAS domain-containing protein [Mycobacteriaceae bacterium]
MRTLAQLPALVVLELIPVPVFAVTDDGSILFANNAFAAMIGYDQSAVVALNFREIFRTPADDSVLSVVRAHADAIVELAHTDGSTVMAKMSKSALMRGDDPVALAALFDLTELLWDEGR